MIIRKKKIDERLRSIITLQLNDLYYGELIFPLMSHKELEHLIVFVNGFENYDELLKVAQKSFLKRDKRLDFLDEDKIPDLNYLKTRFQQWISLFYSKCLLDQIANYTNIDEQLGLKIDNTTLNDQQVFDLININHNNVLMPPNQELNPDVLMHFIYNAQEKYSKKEQQYIDKINETINQSTGEKSSPRFSNGAYILSTDSKIFKNTSEQLAAIHHKTQYFCPKHLSDLLSFQHQIREVSTYFLKEDNLFIFNNAHKQNQIPLAFNSLVKSPNYTPLNNIFLIDFKCLNRNSTSPNILDFLWIEIVQNRRHCNHIVITNASKETFKIRGGDFFKVVLANSTQQPSFINS